MITRKHSANPHLRGWTIFRLVWAHVLVLCAALVLCMARPLLATGDPKPGTIMSPRLNMRSGPGLHHPKITKLHQGDRVLVLSYEGEWVRILFRDQTGFIMNRSRFLRIDEPEPAPTTSMQTPGSQAEKADVNRKLQASSRQIASISKKENVIGTELEETEKALNEARRHVSRLTKELVAATEQIGKLEKKHFEIQAHADMMEQYIAGRLAALYKLSWLGKVQVLASADSMFEFFFRKHSLERIIENDEAVMEALAKDKAEIQNLLEQLHEQKREKQATAADLTAKIDTMNAQQARRQALLSKIRNKKSLQLAVLDALKASARELDRTVEALGVSEKTQTVQPLIITEKPFAALKGLLMMPVRGKIVSFFGPFKDKRFRVTHFQSGITIKADRGEPIRAVYSGNTLFASWFKGFGNMIIIDHGDHYYTVYAHLEELFKSKGDPVETGEVIATVGDTGSLTGAGLHFEVRYHGKPINPMYWIKKG